MQDIEHPEVHKKFHSYPEPFREKLLFLRRLILDTAASIDDVGELAETTKWGEPSYVSKCGSTIRIDWKEKNPDRYAMFFHCSTKLVATFKELYRDEFNFEGNRAIVFYKDDAVAIDALGHCIALALTYHKVKHLPMLGA